MAEVTITIKDTETGLVEVRLEFTPPLKNDACTPAQAAALDAVESIRAQMGAIDE